MNPIQLPTIAPIPLDPVAESPPDDGPAGSAFHALDDARKTLVRENLGLVSVHLRRHVLKRRSRRRARLRDDFFQEGCLGLIRAASDYRPERGIPFAAFALPRIRKAVNRLILADPRFNPRQKDRLPSAKPDPDPSPPGASDPLVPMSPETARPRRGARRAASPQRPQGLREGPTVGDRLREKFERAVRRAALAMERDESARGDRRELVSAIAESRYLIPDEHDRRSYRDIARRTGSSFSRVLRCDRQLAETIRRELESDPEFLELRRIARADPDGYDAALDPSTERDIARIAAEAFLARFRQAGADERAAMIAPLLHSDSDHIEPAIREMIERLPESRRELLYDRTPLDEPSARTNPTRQPRRQSPQCRSYEPRPENRPIRENDPRRSQQ